MYLTLEVLPVNTKLIVKLVYWASRELKIVIGFYCQSASRGPCPHFYSGGMQTFHTYVTGGKPITTHKNTTGYTLDRYLNVLSETRKHLTEYIHVPIRVVLEYINLFTHITVIKNCPINDKIA